MSSDSKSDENHSIQMEVEMDLKKSPTPEKVSDAPQSDTIGNDENSELEIIEEQLKSIKSPSMEKNEPEVSEEIKSPLGSSTNAISSMKDTCDLESVTEMEIDKEPVSEAEDKKKSDANSEDIKNECKDSEKSELDTEKNKSSTDATDSSNILKSETITRSAPSSNSLEDKDVGLLKKDVALKNINSPKCDTPETIISDVECVGEKTSQEDILESGKVKSGSGTSEILTEKSSSPPELETDGKDEKLEKSPTLSTQTKSTSEHKKGDGEKKKKKKTCEECKMKKKNLKFQVLFQGKTRFLCSDECFKNFKTNQNKSKPSAESPTSSTPKPSVDTPDICGHCKKSLKVGEGFYPEVGEIQPLCSEECIKKYEENKCPPKFCSQCKKTIEDRYNYLTWETMAYCNEDCLGKYQAFLGSQCTCCQSPVQQSSLGKYCVCFGSDIKQFCSGGCLEEFKKSLKVCTFCQTDLSSVDAFLAPVGEMGSFKDFCSQPCMVQYEVMNNKLEAIKKVHDCAQCGKQGTFKIVVKYEEKWHGLCSGQCVGGFRYAKKIKLNVCETCCKIIQSETESKYTLTHEGMHKNFCTRPCMTLYTLSNRKIIPCVTCKVKKYNFDMIEKFDKNEQTKVFCSLNCLSLYRVSLNVTSAQSVRCDHCAKNLPAQYHLTMSDGSVRNFCNYPCVVMFQNQFPNVPALTNSSTSRPSSTVARTLTITSGTPVISNVMSLATQPPIPRTMAPPSAMSKHVVNQKLSSRNPGSPIGITVTKSPGASPSYQSTSSSTVSSNPANQQIVREVIVKPPAPKSVKNKTVSCKPIMQTKAILCKPVPCHKAVQTDDRPLPVIVPFPCPVYVPLPYHMFSRPVPVPIPFGIPIPFPLVMPSSSKEAQNDDAAVPSTSEVNARSNSVALELPKIPEVVAENGNKNLPGEDLAFAEQGEYFFKETKSQSRAKRSMSNHENEKPEKRIKTSELPIQGTDFPNTLQRDEDQNRTTCQADHPETYNTQLKHTFGVNAWRQWVLDKNTRLEQGSQLSRNFKPFKTELVQLLPDELNYSLSLFVKEVRKPSGEEYGSGSIFYLCLGIQQYLFQNARMDNIFTEPYYDGFTNCLHAVLKKQEELIPPEDFAATRIEEEVLWEAKQLGAHSPHVLLNTLMYFNTKYFKLQTVEDHARLSFTHLTKHWKKVNNTEGRGNFIIRYYPPLNKDLPRRSKDEPPVYEQAENFLNPLRCPVKLYEFYLSKCPESVKTRNDLFYLCPERSCVPDSPVWYSTQPLSQESIAKMTQRIKIIREAHV